MCANEIRGVIFFFFSAMIRTSVLRRNPNYTPDIYLVQQFYATLAVLVQV